MGTFETYFAVERHFSGSFFFMDHVLYKIELVIKQGIRTKNNLMSGVKKVIYNIKKMYIIMI